MKNLIIAIFCFIIAIFCIANLSFGQVSASSSISDTLTKATIIKDSKVALLKSQPLVTVKEVTSTGTDGKPTIQKTAEDDVGITIHHHWTKYPTEANTIMQVGKSRYTGTSTFNASGDTAFTCKEAIAAQEDIRK